MILIAHRGNIYGPNPARENSPDYIDEALDKGYDVEIDLRYNTEIDKNHYLYLGHDTEQYPIDANWLLERASSLWVHCKNMLALTYMNSAWINSGLTHKPPMNYFWHQEDDYTITSDGYIWAYPGKKMPVRASTVMVMPEPFWSVREMIDMDPFAICTDYCRNYRNY